MESTQDKIESNPSQINSKTFLLIQVLFRAMVFATSLIAAVVMATNEQTVEVYTIHFQAKFNHSPAFSFLLGGNAIASFYALVSLLLVFILNFRSSNSRSLFMFLSDLVVMCLVLAASSAATAIAYLGKNGNSHAGWAPVCDQVGKFCDKSGASLVCSYASFVLFFLLLVLSANRSHQAAVASAY